MVFMNPGSSRIQVEMKPIRDEFTRWGAAPVTGQRVILAIGPRIAHHGG